MTERGWCSFLSPTEGESLRTYARAYLCGAGSDPELVWRQAAPPSGRWLVQTAAEGAATNEFLVEMLAAQTFRAEASGSMLARSAEMDFLLRLAGTTQISRAIREKGSAKGEPFLLVVAGRTKPRRKRGVPGEELPRRELSKSELQRVEKAALLNVQKA